MKPAKIFKGLSSCDILCSFYGQSWLGSHRDLLNAIQRSPDPFQGQPFLFSKAGISCYCMRWPAENGRGDISPPLFKSFGMDAIILSLHSPPPSGQARLPRKYQAGTQIAKIHGDTDIVQAHRDPGQV